VVLALTERAAGRRRTDWARIKRMVGLDAGNKGVYRRYTRAISGIAKRLNGRPCESDRLKNRSFLPCVPVKVRGAQGAK
jgi:pantothenate kinase type III